MLEDFKCPLSEVALIEEWVKKEDDTCPPCLIAPLASWYIDRLNQANRQDLAQELQTVYEEADILTIARKLDTIKQEVGSDTRKDLEDYDCMAQIFESDEEEI